MEHKALEKRIDTLEVVSRDTQKVLNKLETLMETAQVESARHNKRMETIMDSLTNFTNFMELTNYKLAELKSNTQCSSVGKSLSEDVARNSTRLEKLGDYVKDNTTNGCSALKIAMEGDKVSKNKVENLKDDVKEISDNLKWLWRTVVGAIVVISVKTIVS